MNMNTRNCIFLPCDSIACTATHGIAVAILYVCLFARLSVCPSDACIVTKLNDGLRIFWYHTKRQSLVVFWHQHWLVGDAPSLSNIHRKWPTPLEKRRLRQISAHNVSTVRDSEKKFNYRPMTNRKSITSFPASYVVRTLPLSPERVLKKAILWNP